MRIPASIRHRPTWIIGWPQSGRRGAAASDPGAKLLPFRFEVRDDGAGGYLLIFKSTDGAYAADTWHETMEDAFASAEDVFGVRRDECEQPREP